MTANVIALGLTAVISIVAPLIILGSVIWKNPMERKHVVLMFLAGAGSYLLMEWGLKEQTLKALFNHTSFSEFVNGHYIPYLLLVALAGAVLALIPALLVVCILLKKQVSFAKASMYGLGYATAEAVMLAGYRCIFSIIELVKNPETELNTTTVELFLSCYERILVMLIHIAVMVVLVYFIEQKMAVRGSVIAVLCLTMASFLPGFFIAFTLKNYYEVYDRNVALILVYVVLTMAAFCSGIVLNGLKYSLKDERIDSKQVIAEYRRKVEEKKKRVKGEITFDKKENQ